MSTRYTALRVVDEGVVLFAYHAQRLAPHGGPLTDAFHAFADKAAPGVYSVWAQEDELRIEPRADSRLHDGMPVQFAVSPFAGGRSSFPKLPPPSDYDAVRAPGVSTLLTSADGTELYESCSASLVGWDGARFVFAPLHRPRVESTSEAALRDALPCIERPLLSDEALPLLLINAVKGSCRIAIHGRDPFPDEQRALIDEALRATTRR